MPVKSVTTGITCAPYNRKPVHNLVSHAITCLLCRYAAGDLLAQSFEKDDNADPGAAKKGFNWERAAVFMAFGTFLAGPVCVRACPSRLCSCCHTFLCSYTVWFDKIDRLPYLLYTMKQNARKQQVESILKYAMEKGLAIPAEIAKTPELHRITYVGSKILADQLVFSSL